MDKEGLLLKKISLTDSIIKSEILTKNIDEEGIFAEEHQEEMNLQLNEYQRSVFDHLKNLITTSGNPKNIFFIDRPSGTGKTLLSDSL